MAKRRYQYPAWTGPVDYWLGYYVLQGAFTWTTRAPSLTTWRYQCNYQYPVRTDSMDYWLGYYVKPFLFSFYVKKRTPGQHLRKFLFDFSLNFQMSIGQGWGRTAWKDGTAWTGPSPGQLKFEIFKSRIDSSTMTTTTTITTTTTTTKTNRKKTKCVSNDRSRHEDQFCPKIVKIGAILGG